MLEGIGSMRWLKVLNMQMCIKVFNFFIYIYVFYILWKRCYSQSKLQKICLWNHKRYVFLQKTATKDIVNCQVICLKKHKSIKTMSQRKRENDEGSSGGAQKLAKLGQSVSSPVKVKHFTWVLCCDWHFYRRKKLTLSKSMWHSFDWKEMLQLWGRRSLSIYANFLKALKNARLLDAEVHFMDLFGQAKVWKTFLKETAFNSQKESPPLLETGLT